ncbi:hypothetical protein DGM85_18845 [Xanthomonas phaseoli pv. phaseoli]|uniref:Transmembrane protein n=1 Tax=Xanthomonas campestris pv. phaseoli TaxID=317013 RepID=A0AB38E0X8_XANCH|nr:hypothetical protein [Xanthomonas phaseoli]QWN23614.1 hypothetical protein DGM93_03875 [Xanthomonas phaseoli pv. phaseoli]QWN30232.1 hypothetical protein DGM85_18845 [Xanthomonas phaseoli pv. phaseoli]QWN31972.1 hypothetical protein DGM81_03895 [Xanthomonas phaseoli pv. phaseoli]SON82220.1 conserved membrane hypothetical protein [Xanthomonas phaseoli pv. phaseoli]SON85115.1 conserved membrane hypothetical protein [Xanthomonas phaseoli pv. phaseoli]
MASASIRKTNAAPHSKSEPVAKRCESGLPAFLIAVVALSLLSQPLLVQSVARAPALAPDIGVPATGLLAWAVDLTLHRWNLPFQVWPCVAVAANALFLSLLWRDLAGVFGRGWASALTLLVGCNPLFLLPIAAGGSQAVGLLAFYGLCRTLRRLQAPVEAFTYLRIAGWLCILLCLDLQTLALSTMVAPWLLLVMPPQMLRKAPGSFYLVCYLPFAFLVGMWAYVNLVVFNAPWPTLSSIAQASHPLPLPLAGHADGWLPAVRWGVAAVVCFPVLALVARTRSGALARGVVASAGTVICAAALSFVFGWAGFDALLLLWVPAALLLRALHADQRGQAAGLLVLGLVGAVWAQPQGWGSWTRGAAPDEQALMQGEAVVMTTPVALPVRAAAAPATHDAGVMLPAMAEGAAVAPAATASADTAQPANPAAVTVVPPDKNNASLRATACSRHAAPPNAEVSAACSSAF